MKELTKQEVLDKVNIHMFAADQCPDKDEYPRLEILDLVGFFYVPYGVMELRVSRSLMVVLGVTNQMIRDAAIKNLKNEKYSFKTLIKELDIEPRDSFDEFIFKSIWVVKRKDDKQFGAAGIFKKDLLNRLASRTHGDLYIIPISKHELLIAPQALFNGVNACRIILQNINKGMGAVRPEDVLTNSVYLYDQKQREVVYA